MRMRVLTLLLTLVVVPVVISLDQKRTAMCYWISTHDCGDLPQLLVCATNGVTYDNYCLANKAYCKDHTIQRAHFGPCFNATSPPDHVHGPPVLLDSVCKDITAVNCSTDGPWVCGSNGITYTNMCVFRKAKCLYPDLHLSKPGC